MTLKELRAELINLFKSHNIESPEADSGLLLMHVFNLDKTRLLLENFSVDSDCYHKALSLANRRISGEPVRYILGSCPFMDLDFEVNPSTLIPRQDTEILVDAVSERIDAFKAPVTMWDIGCGSGCIGISLAFKHVNLRVTEFDISDDALKTAERTAHRYSLLSRISFVRHDILKGMPNLPSPQIIVSNPPYIPTDVIRTLQHEVKDFEPVSALDGGSDGLVFYRKIIKDAPLSPGDLLAFEIGYDQGSSVPDLMESCGYKNITLLHDLSGNPRVVLGYA